MTRRQTTSQRQCRHNGCTQPRAPFVHFRYDVDNGGSLHQVSRYCMYHTCGEWVGAGGIVCGRERRMHAPSCDMHMHIEMQQAVAWRRTRHARAAALASLASESTNYAEARYVEAAPVFDYQESASAQPDTPPRQTTPPPQTLPTCRHEDCPRVQAAGSVFCAGHKCRVRDCAEDRYGTTRRCKMHQQCSHPDCQNYQVVHRSIRAAGSGLTGGGSARDGFYSPSKLKGYCELHHACGDQGDHPDHVCETSVARDEKYCEQHRCQAPECQERRDTWKLEENLFCESHTCHAERVCRNQTHNSAEERRFRFCERHTCKVQNCFNRRCQHHGELCEVHSYLLGAHMSSAWVRPEGELPPSMVPLEAGDWYQGYEIPPAAYGGQRRYFHHQHHHRYR